MIMMMTNDNDNVDIKTTTQLTFIQTQRLLAKNQFDDQGDWSLDKMIITVTSLI